MGADFSHRPRLIDLHQHQGRLEDGCYRDAQSTCDELKLDPREARERLRAAASDPKANPELAKARKPRTPWQWVKGSPVHKEALSTLKK